MATFEDKNQVKWEIRTTSVSVDDANPNTQFFANVAPDSLRDYSNFQFGLDEEKETLGGREIVLSWPINGNPFIRGKGDEKVAESVIKSFAERERNGGNKTLTVKVSSSPANSPSSPVPLLILVAFIYWADKRR